MPAEEKHHGGRLFRKWREKCSSKVHCLSKIPKSESRPTFEALSEAEAIVTEQILTKQLSGSTNGDRAQKLSANSFIEQYAFAFYTTEVFEIWHHMSIRDFRNLPERKPTITERSRFEKLFYQILRYVIMKEERFETEMREEKLSLAEVNRLQNFFSFLCNASPPSMMFWLSFKVPKPSQHVTGFPKFEMRKADTGSPLKDGAAWVCEPIFDDVQAEMEYDCSDDTDLPEPDKPAPW